MGMPLLDLMDDLEKRRSYWWWDDFTAYQDTIAWTKTLVGAGVTVTNPSAVNGVLSIGNAGSAINAEAMVATTNANWQFQTNKALLFEARINYQEANVNNACIFAGFSSAFATGLLAATTGVPNTGSMSALGIYKQAGDTIWRGVVQVGTTQTLTGVTNQTSGKTGDQILRIEARTVGTTIECVFLIADAETTGGADTAAPVGFQQMQETSSGFLKPIKKTVAFAGAVKMNAGFYLRQITTTAETLKVDYVGVQQLR